MTAEAQPCMEVACDAVGVAWYRGLWYCEPHLAPRLAYRFRRLAVALGLSS